MAVEWKDFEDLLEVSNTGEVRYRHTKVPVPVFDFGGHKDNRYLGFYFDKNRYIHRVVCELFHGPCPGVGYTVDHIDRNRKNNNAWNLRWLPRSEQNMNRGLCKVPTKNSKTGLLYIRTKGYKNRKGEDVMYYNVVIEKHDLFVRKNFKDREEAIKFRDEAMAEYESKRKPENVITYA